MFFQTQLSLMPFQITEMFFIKPNFTKYELFNGKDIIFLYIAYNITKSCSIFDNEFRQSKILV
jgi:hypothetical protein